MRNCIICGVEHDRLWNKEPARYCDSCAKIKKDSEGAVTHVLGSLYLGDYEAAKEFIGTRICVYCDEPEYDGPFYHIPILATRPKSQTDRTATASIAALDKAADLITESLETGRKVLVHCMGGVERSPLTIAWWLVKTNRCTTIAGAYQSLKAIRPVVADRTSWLPRD